ncbi:Anillin [Nymphon striatum]|nr:Anillin [Nymphon striatum]
MATISSPGGPLAIRTSSFAIIGYTKLCLKNLSRKVFALEKVPTTSPLEGNVYMKVKCHADLRADQRGFLTMFEDVSGFGAWHRRWCVLTGQHLAYWKYPNDEKKKEPIGFIDLRRCITENVTSAPREICARLNTLMMVTMRPLSEGAEEDLITHKYDTVTTTKTFLGSLDAPTSSQSKSLDNKFLEKAIQDINLTEAMAVVALLTGRDAPSRPLLGWPSCPFCKIALKPRPSVRCTNLVPRPTNETLSIFFGLGALTNFVHLLSADSKEERIWWCEKINQALSNIRKWDPHALRPASFMFRSTFSSLVILKHLDFTNLQYKTAKKMILVSGETTETIAALNDSTLPNVKNKVESPSTSMLATFGS